MKVQFSSKAIQDALRQCASVTGGPDHVNLLADKTSLHIVASGNDVSVKIRVKGSHSEKEGEITAGLNSLMGLTKNRGDLTLESGNKESKLVIKSTKGGKYYGDVVIPPFAKVTLMAGNKNSKEFKFDKTVQALLEESLAKVALSNVYTETPMYFSMKGTKNGAVVVCGDHYHVAHYCHPNVDVGKKSLTVPVNVLKTIQTIANKEQYKISMDGNYIFAYNNDMYLAMPMVQPDSSTVPTVEQASDLVANLKKVDCQFLVDREKMTTSLSNIESVAEPEIPLEITLKDDRLTLSFKSGQSEVKETIKVKHIKGKSGSSISCDPTLLSDILSLVSDKDVVVSFILGATVFIKVVKGEVVTHYSCVVQ